MEDIRVKSLHIYPVKSCAGIEVDQINVLPQGPQYDRQWMFVDEEGKFVTQRQHPKMALIQTSIDAADLRLGIDGSEVLVPLRSAFVEKNDSKFGEWGQGNSVDVNVWRDTLPALLVSDEASEAVSDFLGAKVFLVAMPEGQSRLSNEKYEHSGKYAFADGYPFLVISQESLDHLNEKLDEPVEMNRFRPNIVLEGGGVHFEDQLKTFKLGDMKFFVTKPCVRCNITRVEQASGELTDSPLKTLAGYRRSELGITFGINLVCLSQGLFFAGDEFYPEDPSEGELVR